MAAKMGYSLADVVTVAKMHPFYNSNIQYPPDQDTIREARRRAELESVEVDLASRPVLQKKDLYETIRRLVDDTSPTNTYRQSIYISITGGGSSSKPMFFATDVFENRKHRAYFGDFLRATGVIQETDWVLTTHCACYLYRSLDLISEIVENAGASILSAGNYMSPAEVARHLAHYHVTTLSGDGSQVVQVVRYLSTMPAEERAKIKLDKVIYTSEALSAAQTSYITAVLGPITLCSILGSAEAGPYAISNPHLTPRDPSSTYVDFVFDTRITIIEILKLSSDEHDRDMVTVPDGEIGNITLTSLVRLRNPVVRYITGDIGSLHSLSDEAKAKITESYRPFVRIVRLRGRDNRFSFTWDGNYISFEGLTNLMADPKLGILQWQVILDKMEGSEEVLLEIRLLYSQRESSTLSKEDVIARIREFFGVHEPNEYRFRARFVNLVTEFEMSTTGRKVIKFVDRVN